MEGQKDEVVNLFYLFNEGDLYKVEEDLPSLMMDNTKLSQSTSQEPAIVKIPDITPVAQSNEPPIVLAVEALLPQEETAATIIHAEAEALIAELVIEPVGIQEQEPTIAVVEPVIIAEQAPIEPKSAENTLKAEVREPLIAEPEPTKLAHSIFLVVSESRSASLNVYDEAFLEKVLQAVGVSLDKVTLINVSGLTNPDYHYIFREKQVREFISFGVPMEELNLYLPLLPYEVKFFHGIQFLYTDSLEGIRTDIERKKWLWTALKQMFGMK